MPKVFAWSVVVYRWQLWLYPSDLRSSHSIEMADAFERQLDSDWRDRGVPGVLLTWLRALNELFTVALPGQVSNERIIAPGLSLLITPAVLLSLVAVMQDLALADWINHKFLFGGLCR